MFTRRIISTVIIRWHFPGLNQRKPLNSSIWLRYSVLLENSESHQSTKIYSLYYRKYVWSSHISLLLAWLIFINGMCLINVSFLSLFPFLLSVYKCHESKDSAFLIFCTHNTKPVHLSIHMQAHIKWHVIFFKILRKVYLEDNCFTMLCWFLPHHSCESTRMHISPPFRVSLPPHPQPNSSSCCRAPDWAPCVTQRVPTPIC